MNIADKNDNNISVSIKSNDHATPNDQKSESSLVPFINNPFTPLKNECSLISSNAGNHHNGFGFLEPVKGDQSFSLVDPSIGAGLENLGNTCFLNSVLQCLTYTEPLAEYLQYGTHQMTCQFAGFCALCAVQKHVSCALQSSGKCLSPVDFFIHLPHISQTFRYFRQEDAHEYMVNLLETMHKCCLPSRVPTESPACEKSFVYNIFGGRLRSQLKCMQCNYCSNKFEQFLDLSLDIVKANTLYQAFSHFTAKELLDGGAKQYNCERCKQKVKALKQLTIHDAPKVLIIHLKRFGADISGQKINKKVFFPATLDLKPFVTGSYDGDLRYTLYGVLVHAGPNTHSGHYYCYVRTSSGIWYLLNDDEVTQVNHGKVFEKKAYMLFYFRSSKNLPAKKVVGVVHQKETALKSMGINTNCPIISKEKMVDQKVVSEFRSENFPLLPHQQGVVNGSSVLHETIISDISVVKNPDFDAAAKMGIASLTKDVVPPTSDGSQMHCPVNGHKEAVLTTTQEDEEKRSTRDDLCDLTVNVANDATVPFTANGPQMLCPVNGHKEDVLTTTQEHEEKRSTHDNPCDLTVNAANDANVPSTSNCLQVSCPVNDQREVVLTTVQEHEEKSTHNYLCDLIVHVANDATVPSTSSGPQMLYPVNDQREAGLTTVQEHEEKRGTHDLYDLTVNVANGATVASTSNGPQILCPVNGQQEIVLTKVQEHEEKRSTHDNLCELTGVMICTNPQEDSGDPARVAKEDVAPVEPCCSSVAGDSLKEAFTSILSIDAGDSLKGAITSTERSGLSKIETFTTSELSQDVALIEPCCCNGAGDDQKGAIVSTEGSSLPKVESFSIETKVLDSRRYKKRKNHLKVSTISMKLCGAGSFSNQQKKKKHKRKKRSKLPINNVHVNTGSKIEDKTRNVLVNRIHRELRERFNNVCGESSSEVTGPESLNNCMTRVFEDKIDANGSTPSQIRETQDVQSTSHVGDKWDEKLERRKRKRRRGCVSLNFDGKNGFQDDIADERLDSNAGKRKKRGKKHSKRFSRSGKRLCRR